MIIVEKYYFPSYRDVVGAMPVHAWLRIGAMSMLCRGFRDLKLKPLVASLRPRRGLGRFKKPILRG